MTKKIKFLEDCIFQRDLIYKKDKLYAIKSEDSTHYIVPGEFGNENELSKVRSIFEYEIIEEPKVTKYIKITDFTAHQIETNNHLDITLHKWYEICGDSEKCYSFYNDNGDFTYVLKSETNYIVSEGHPHKHLIKKAAELAESTMDVGSHFQYKNEGVWTDCRILPSFHIDTEFRLKPRTIKIGNREINAPEKGPLKDGQTYYTLTLDEESKYHKYSWTNAPYDVRQLQRNLVFLNREDVLAAAEAMLELLRGDA